MKAWVGTRAGQPDQVLKLHTDRPVPPPPTGSNLLVKVTYAALNPADVVFIRFLPTLLPFRRQPTPGLDFCGRVVLAGPAAPAEFGPGTDVCGALSVGLVATGNGSLAEYVVVPAALVAVKPPALTDAAAAGLGTPGQTATIALREAGVKEGDRVLVNGASGGLGNMLVQLSKGHGADVVGVCSGPNAAMVKRLGAEEVSAPVVAPQSHSGGMCVLNLRNRRLTIRHMTLYTLISQRSTPGHRSTTSSTASETLFSSTSLLTISSRRGR